MAYRDKEFADITRKDYERRKKVLEGIEEELFAEKDDTSIIDNAREQIGMIEERGRAQTDRDFSRYGISLAGAQAKAADRNLGLATARTGSDLMNNATIAQEGANQSVLQALVATGRNEQKNALGQLSSVAGMESQRIAAGQQAAAQARNQRNQMLGTMASLGMFAVGAGFI